MEGRTFGLLTTPEHWCILFNGCNLQKTLQQQAGAEVLKTQRSVLRGFFCLFGGAFVREKSGFPLNNPLPRKAVVADATRNKALTTGISNSDRREKGVWQGGKERVRVAEAVLRCQMCGREQKLVFAFRKTPEWHRCIWCGELQPMDGYRVIAYGLGLPRPLAPHEVKNRAEDLAQLHEGARE